VDTVLDAPVAAHGVPKGSRGQGSAQDVVATRGTHPRAHAPLFLDHAHALQPRPVAGGIEVSAGLGVLDRPVAADLQPPMHVLDTDIDKMHREAALSSPLHKAQHRLPC